MKKKKRREQIKLTSIEDWADAKIPGSGNLQKRAKIDMTTEPSNKTRNNLRTNRKINIKNLKY